MRVLPVSEDSGTDAIREAGDILRRGGLVAFPTETVYGLGANALDPDAVRRIYDAKGRPAINPLIVHVASVHAARALASNWTPMAEALAVAFWPGPLTLVVRKKAIVPDIVTAGGDTVGLRVPSHPVALALLAESALPIAAPSANLATQVSPTTAQHVASGLGDRVDVILDGGPTTVGIESTVVDVTGRVPRILRPGMVSSDAIARVAGEAVRAWSRQGGETPRSPGLMGKHYAPRARVTLWRSADRDAAAAEAGRLAGTGVRVGAIDFGPFTAHLTAEKTLPADPGSYARELYAALHALDEARCDVILVERPPDLPEWAGIIDRLERAVET